jgi:UDP-N-acetylglucosamine 2-epimerase (non-hydrolysing)/GDP/UDP-N,N'-diacetylbacillosamine 2-epimerase (hydrolysing)
MNKRKICIITGTRAEYGLFYPIMKEIKLSDKLILQLVVTTMHLSETFGLTYKQIEEDGFVIDEKVENLIASNSKSAMAKSTGLAILLLSDTFRRLQPDMVLLLGDRFETHAAATTAMLMNIPIAHIHGGEITEGAIDEQIRHSITKMAHIHFTSTEIYRKRIIQMGEDPKKVFFTGAPGLDNIVNMDLMTKENLENTLNWGINFPTALFTYHPETLHSASTESDIIEILNQIKKSKINVLFTYANADDSGIIINREIEKFCKDNSDKYKVVKSLGQMKYLSAMKYVDMMIGNTSSGIIEAASFNLPVINIGNRQKGRLRNDNIIDSTIILLENKIKNLISTYSKIQYKNRVNIYGEGKASLKIVKYLEELPLKIEKRFYDL